MPKIQIFEKKNSREMFDAVELFKNPLEWSFCSLCQCNLKVNNPEKHFKKCLENLNMMSNAKYIQVGTQK